MAWCRRCDECQHAGNFLVAISCGAHCQHEQSVNHTSPRSRLRRSRHGRVQAQWQPVTTVIPLRLMLLAPPFSRILRRNGCALELTHLVTNHSRLAHRAARSTSLGLVREDPGFWGTTDRDVTPIFRSRLELEHVRPASMRSAPVTSPRISVATSNQSGQSACPVPRIFSRTARAMRHREATPSSRSLFSSR